MPGDVRNELLPWELEAFSSLFEELLKSIELNLSESE